ncbi:MAG: vitamin B12-dependent ribonucleotide reductase [Patescibacteria group bacterium]
MRKDNPSGLSFLVLKKGLALNPMLLMSDSSFGPKVVAVSSPDGVSDAAWSFVTSLKIVTKRSGITEPFQAEKIKRSVGAAMVEAGVKDMKLIDKITRHAVSRLQRAFEGDGQPTTMDVREMINLTLIDHNLIHAAKKYMSFRAGSLHRAHQAGEAVYGHGLQIKRYFTEAGVHPYEKIKWELRDARINNEKGKVVFEQTGVEVPEFWSQTATNIMASKYFRGKVGQADREQSARQLIDRVAKTIAGWGRQDGYFQTADDGTVFEHELTHILINQMAAFNSPVWFNVGVVNNPQCSACFINSVQDDMRSILNLAVTEGMLFKGGSGTGTNFSTLRSSKEYLGGSNGRASGPVSFMKGLDSFAGVIKSGGKTRRAAKMVVLNVDHPDIEEFIICKAEEEKKAWALMDAGYDGSIDGSAYSSIYFQNANNSVRVNDDFMNAIINGGDWVTKEVISGNPSTSFKAADLMKKICEAAWQCGDPGLQYDTESNKWHTCKKSGRINASNPCSEFMFLDDSACNLSSLNLMRFRKEVNGLSEFDLAAFKQANEIMITAMEIIVGNSSYPTPAIEENSLIFRPLGIGYANLGALLMSFGLAYDSDNGRNLAAAITSLQSGVCYAQSTRIAEKKGPFISYQENAESMLDVMRRHRDETDKLPAQGVSGQMLSEAREAWREVVERGARFGFRNSQISLLAPTGTIAFLMDCDTTGVEPDIALVKYKWLVGGGMIKIVNKTVPEALTRLGYTEDEKKDILAYINEKDTIEGAPHFKEEHLSVFDCAFKPANGTRSIQYMGHLRMMAAVQPFLSGAISKTVNLPNSATVEDIEKVYVEAWKMGIKAVAVYRDGSKRQQALTTSLDKDQSKKVAKKAEVAVGDGRNETFKPLRRRLPDERKAITHKFQVGTHKGYLTVGLYDDGTPGEMFITMSKEGSVISGLADAFATSVSVGLQYGVPLQSLVNRFVHMRFEPSGYTNNPNIRIAKSLVDYIFRWMAMKFMTPEEQRAVGVMNVENNGVEETVIAVPALADSSKEEPQPTLFTGEKKASLTSTFDNQSDAPACPTCGSIMVRNASCYKCLNCGATSGCS